MSFRIRSRRWNGTVYALPRGFSRKTCSSRPPTTCTRWPLRSRRSSGSRACPGRAGPALFRYRGTQRRNRCGPRGRGRSRRERVADASAGDDRSPHSAARPGSPSSWSNRTPGTDKPLWSTSTGTPSSPRISQRIRWRPPWPPNGCSRGCGRRFFHAYHVPFEAKLSRTIPQSTLDEYRQRERAAEQGARRARPVRRRQSMGATRPGSCGTVRRPDAFASLRRRLPPTSS